MEPSDALDELMDLSSQVEAAVVLDEGGNVLASTLPDERAPGLARAGSRLLEAAGRVRTGAESGQVSQIGAATPTGSVFLVREGNRTILATTGAAPTAGLVLYDLRTCLRSLGEEISPET
ncbi:MAG: roadblock/LC7 domain-containing protein [Actinobacteria bacterium]|nr:roadblock/LC7 domain-containing protein [Actinomycetota bacterium]